MKNVKQSSLRTCICLYQKEFEEVIDALYAGAIAGPDDECPWLINVDLDGECLDYYIVIDDLANYFDIDIQAYHAETGMDGAYTVWIDYTDRKE